MTSLKPYRSALAIAALALLAAACSSGDGVLSSRAGQGQVRIVLASSAGTPLAATGGGDSASATRSHGDSEGGRILSTEVTFSSILARTLQGELVGVGMELPVVVDLHSLVDGGELVLPIGFLPPDTYDQIVIVMIRVALTLQDGTVIEITPPGGGWTAIVPTEPFTVIEGETTTVQLRFLADRSFLWMGDRWEFHPEFDGHHGYGDHDED
jgi:hypothetical protein